MNHRHRNAEVLEFADGFLGVLERVLLFLVQRDAPHPAAENRHAVPVTHDDERFLAQPLGPGFLRGQAVRAAAPKEQKSKKYSRHVSWRQYTTIAEIRGVYSCKRGD